MRATPALNNAARRAIDQAFRLALALTGDAASAARAVAALPGAFADLARAANIRIESRLIEACRREPARAAPNSALGWPDSASRLWSAAARLERLDYELFMLVSITQRSVTDAARVFEAEEGFVRARLESARASIERTLGSSIEPGIQALRNVIGASDSSAALEAAELAGRAAARRRLRWTAIKLISFGIFLAFAAYTLLDLMARQP